MLRSTFIHSFIHAISLESGKGRLGKIGKNRNRRGRRVRHLLGGAWNRHQEHFRDGMRAQVLHVVFAVILETKKHVPHLSRGIGTRARLRHPLVRFRRNWSHPRRRTDHGHAPPDQHHQCVFWNERASIHDVQSLQRVRIQRGARHRPMAEKLRRKSNRRYIPCIMGKF